MNDLKPKREGYIMGAAILAGGKAKRMKGTIKGNLEIRPQITIIQHLLNAIASAGITETIIVANNSAPYLSYGTKVIADLQHKGNGPLAGIISALHYYEKKYEAVLIMPCDMPYIQTSEIISLQEAYLFLNVPIVYASTKKSLHPLCAIINCKVVNNIDNLLTKGIKRVRNVWEELRAKTVFFNDEKPFININSIAEYEAIKEI